jgi:3-phenylpropionate/cinnamic acid dioxygenase small subunit
LYQRIEDIMSEVQELIDRQAITDLISGLGLWLDEKRFDEARSILTEDVVAETAGGSSRGVEAVAAQARRNHQVPTQHVITNVLVDLDGDRASAGANLVVTFVRPDSLRTLGERYAFDAVRTPEGWRLSRVRITPVWEQS